MKITKKIAKKVVETVNAGLCKGVGTPKAGEMCVEAAVCFAMGLPHGDEPPCVSPAIRAVKIALNDSNWSNNAARAKGMVKLAVLQLGTKDNFDDIEFVNRLAEVAISKTVPRVLRIAASLHPDLKHKEALEQAAIKCEKEKTSDAASYAASYAASDKELTAFAIEVENILIDMKVPGVEWLELIQED